jgi:tRNA(adenine34) deaminase
MKTDHAFFMHAALRMAREAASAGEVPVGAVVARGGEIVAAARNRREELRDPTAHAELLALREAAAALGDWRLSDCTLYVTLEPCPMCAGAAAMARVSLIVFGAWEEKTGCCGSAYDIPGDAVFGSSIPCVGGVMEEECAEVLRRSMKEYRG